MKIEGKYISTIIRSYQYFEEHCLNKLNFITEKGLESLNLEKMYEEVKKTEFCYYNETLTWEAKEEYLKNFQICHTPYVTRIKLLNVEIEPGESKTEGWLDENQRRAASNSYSIVTTFYYQLTIAELNEETLKIETYEDDPKVFNVVSCLDCLDAIIKE